MRVKDFMPTVFETEVAIFECGKVFTNGSVWRGNPSTENWEKFENRKIIQVDAVNEDEDAVIYIIIE